MKQYVAIAVLALACALSGCGNDFSCNDPKLLKLLRGRFYYSLRNSGIYAQFIDVEKSDMVASSFSTLSSTNNQLQCVAVISFSVVLNDVGQSAIDHGTTIGPDLTGIKEKMSHEREVKYSARKADDGRIITRFESGFP